MSVDHPIHSRPTEELLAAGVTAEQVASLHEMSTVMFGDPDRVFAVLGHPDSRGTAATMLGAIHAYRSKSKPMPGRQKEHFEKLRAALEAKPKPPPPMERECSECGLVQPLSEFEGPSRKCNTCNDEEPSVEVTVRRKPSSSEEEKLMDTTAATTKTCIKCDKTKPADTDHFGKDARTSDGLGRTCSECKSSAAKPAKTTTPQGPAEKSPDRPSQPDPPLSDSNRSPDFSDPRLSDLRAVQEILESTLPSVNVAHLEDVVVVLTRIGEHFRQKDPDEG